MNLREQVLLAMGYTIHTEPTCDEGYATKRGCDAIKVCSWHPDTSLDDVRVVEEWLMMTQWREYVQALFAVMTGEERPEPGEWNEPSLLTLFWFGFKASPAERLQACLKVLGIESKEEA